MATTTQVQTLKPAVPFWRTRSFTTATRKAIVFALLCAGTILFAMPFLWMVSTSLKRLDDVWSLQWQWIPNPIQWNNYPEAISNFPFFRYLLNTLFVTIAGTFGVVLSSALVAYGFARFRFKGRDVLFFILLATMMIPSTVTFIPVYLLFARIGWINSFAPLIVPAFFGIPFFIFLMRQFLLTVPLELMKPAIATVAIFSFIGGMNDFFGPLLYLDEPKYTVSLGLAFFRAGQFAGGQFGGRTLWHYMMAIATLTMIPNIILYFFAQKQFIEGITLTGIKG